MTSERRDGWLLIMGASFVLMMLLFTIFYTKHVVRESERRDCGNLAADIEAYRAIPPTAPAGWNQWRTKLERYEGIGCTPHLAPIPGAPPSVPPRRPSLIPTPSR